MDDKRTKPREDANEDVRADRPADAKSSGKPLRRATEGPDNLRRRAEWFNRRRGDTDK